jgi:hypothetical protein
MKKILFLFCMTAAIAGALGAQPVNIKTVRDVNFYGVDFSLASAPDVEETPSRFKSGIVKINDLLFREIQKFNIQKHMGKRVLAYNFAATDSNNANIDAQLLTSRSVREDITEAGIREIIAPLSTGNQGTVGLVFIAETLSKARQAGTFHVVFFDEATKEIIYSRKVTGKGGGFGVRNYWAASIYNILKKWNWK